MDEIWKDVPGFGNYEVSNFGRVRKKPQILKPWLNKQTGYLQVGLGRGERSTVHRLVCAAFHGPQPNEDQCQVAHGDGDRLNNRAENLRWASRRENGADAVRHGTSPLIQYRGGQRGEKHPMARLSEIQIKEIRAKCPDGKARLAVAEEYGISRNHLWRILRGASWT